MTKKGALFIPRLLGILDVYSGAIFRVNKSWGELSHAFPDLYKALLPQPLTLKSPLELNPSQPYPCTEQGSWCMLHDRTVQLY